MVAGSIAERRPGSCKQVIVMMMMIIMTLTWVRGVIIGGDSEASRGCTACTACSAWLACTNSKAALVSRLGSMPAGSPPVIGPL